MHKNQPRVDNTIENDHIYKKSVMTPLSSWSLKSVIHTDTESYLRLKTDLNVKVGSQENDELPNFPSDQAWRKFTKGPTVPWFAKWDQRRLSGPRIGRFKKRKGSSTENCGEGTPFFKVKCMEITHALVTLSKATAFGKHQSMAPQPPEI